MSEAPPPPALKDMKPLETPPFKPIIQSTNKNNNSSSYSLEEEDITNDSFADENSSDFVTSESYGTKNTETTVLSDATEEYYSEEDTTDEDFVHERSEDLPEPIVIDAEPEIKKPITTNRVDIPPPSNAIKISPPAEASRKNQISLLNTPTGTNDAEKEKKGGFFSRFIKKK